MTTTPKSVAVQGEPLMRDLTFNTALRGTPIGYRLRAVERDHSVWVCASDACAILDIFTRVQGGYFVTDTHKLKLHIPEGSHVLARGISDRGPGLVLLRRDAVERLMDLRFRHYVPEFRSWLNESVFSVQTELMGAFLEANGLTHWSPTKVQRFGQLASRYAQRKGIILAKSQSSCVSGGVLIPTERVEWPVGLLAQALSHLAGD